MTIRQLAWGIIVWPFVLVLEMVGLNHLVGYDWDMSAVSVIAVIGGWVLVALLAASLIWVPLGGQILRRLQHRSHTVQGIGFALLGLTMGVLASLVYGLAATVPVLVAGYAISGDFGAWAQISLSIATLFVLPSVLGWEFATAKTTGSSSAQRLRGNLS